MYSTQVLATLAMASLSKAAFFGTVAQAQLESTQFSMTYGLSLAYYQMYVTPLLETVGTNKFQFQRNAATPTNASDAILYPDADTLSSSAVVDLSQRDIELTIPAVSADTYYIFGFYDVWGDNFANLGSVSKAAAGKYLLRSTLDVGKATGFEACNSSMGAYKGYITFPGRYGIIQQRLELSSTSKDLTALHALQDKSTVKEVSRRSSASQAPPMTYKLLNASSSEAMDLNTEIGERLGTTARIAQFNPPEVVADQADVARILAIAGIANGKYVTPSQVNLTEAAYGLRAGTVSDTIYAVKNNGWTQPSRAIQGNFKGDFVTRATLDYLGYLENTPNEALYPTPANGSAPTTGANQSLLGVGSLPIGADEALLLTFSGKPPVNAYWSVTAYDELGQLIESSVDRFSIGSRNNITFSNGTPVYGSKAGPDGQFQILVQPADVEPPQNWVSNWLPSPAGASNTTLNLRFYAPGATLLDNSYKLPTISRQAAIKA